MDVWDGRYRRALLIDGEPVTIEISQHGTADSPTLTVAASATTNITPARLSAMQQHVDRMLALEVDLQPFYDLADADPRLRHLKDRFLGVKPPRFPTLFEALANAVANQQLTLEVGIELLNRLTDAYGTPAPGTQTTLKTFPEPDAVAGASVAALRDLGFSTRKAQYLIGLAGAVSSGALDLDELEAMDRAAATQHLTHQYGIGRWSAEYVLLRGMGRLEVFPADDVGARKKLQRLLGLPTPPSYRDIVAILEPWYPYAGMVYFHLLLDGLAEQGALGR